MKNLCTSGFALLLCCGLAHAATTKFMDWTPTSPESPAVDGVASLKYQAGPGTTRVSVVMHNLLPNTTYGVAVFSDGPGTSVPQAFTTNNGGNGNFQGEFPQDATTLNPVVVIYRWDGDPDEIFNVTAAEMTAFALPN